MSMFKGFSNAFRIPELRKKILVTLGLVAVCRLVSQVPAIGVDWVALQQAVQARAAAASGFSMFDWFDAFTGGALGQCSIGFLSIWPYISAQIVIQLLSSVIPSLQKMKKEGENGRQQLAQITRYLTIVLCLAQSFGVCTALLNPRTMLGLDGVIVPGVADPAVDPTFGFYFMNMVGMTTASLFVMWVADQITTFGIGNGGSLIIMINITSRLPKAIEDVWHRYFHSLTGTTASLAEFAIVMLIGFAVIMGTVMLTQGVRKVAIHATRRSLGGGNTYGMQQTFMPLRVNYSGVMPIIFAQPLVQIPGALLEKIRPGQNAALDWLHDFGAALSSPTSTTHLVTMAALILFFAFFWVATQFNAVEIADNLKKDGSYVPGIRPGRATAEYLDAVMTRVTLIGGTGLLVVALVPSLLTRLFSKPTPLSWTIASFFGGTSLLIIVGVALDTLRIMESHLLVRKYDGFLRHGSLRGRGGM